MPPPIAPLPDTIEPHPADAPSPWPREAEPLDAPEIVAPVPDNDAPDPGLPNWSPPLDAMT